MAHVTARGTPQILDTFLRPVVRILAGLVGGILSVLAGWFGGPWVAPLPLAGALLGAELLFWLRGDRPQELVVADRRLSLVDPFAPTLAVDLGTIHAATAFQRATPDGRLEVVVVLADTSDVRLAFRALQDTPPLTDPDVVPADAMDLLFGGIAGLFRALAPGDRRPRQTFDDPEGRLVAAVRAAVPRDAWNRTAIRLWPGMEPEIDLFGFFRAAHGEFLILDGHDWVRDGEQGSIAGWSVAAAERDAVLFQGLDRQQIQRLPLALLNLGANTTVAMPSPAEAEAGPVQPLTSDLLHTHAPEGAALLWHLLVHTPRDRWPPVIHRMVDERRPIRPDLGSVLPG
jgi:hypothetical protein